MSKNTTAIVGLVLVFPIAAMAAAGQLVNEVPERGGESIDTARPEWLSSAQGADFGLEYDTCFMVGVIVSALLGPWTLYRFGAECRTRIVQDALEFYPGTRVGAAAQSVHAYLASGEWRCDRTGNATRLSKCAPPSR